MLQVRQCLDIIVKDVGKLKASAREDKAVTFSKVNQELNRQSHKLNVAEEGFQNLSKEMGEFRHLTSIDVEKLRQECQTMSQVSKEFLDVVRGRLNKQEDSLERHMDKMRRTSEDVALIKVCIKLVSLFGELSVIDLDQMCFAMHMFRMHWS